MDNDEDNKVIRFKPAIGAGRPDRFPEPTRVEVSKNTETIVDSDAVFYPVEVGQQEQEAARIKELLNDSDEDPSRVG
jgi:hypothetical protein